MKAHVRTWRYGIDTTEEYHGEIIGIEMESFTLQVDYPVLTDNNGNVTYGRQQVVTIVSGDSVILLNCEPKTCNILSHL